MPRSRAVNPRILARSGSVIVAAPRELAADELRLARLEIHLQAQFPDLDIFVTDRLTGPNGQGFVGSSADEGAPPRATVDAVAAAVRNFIDYGERRH